MTSEQNEMIKSCYKKKLGVVQLNAECVLKTENENSIGKILCVSAKPYLESYEALQGELRFNSSVCFNVVYNEETGALCNMKCSSEADGKLENGDIVPSTQAMLQICAVDTSIKSVSSTEVVVNAILEVSAEAFITDEFEQMNPDDDMIKKVEPFKCSNIIATGVDTINLNDEIVVKDKISKIVNNTANVFVKDVKSGTDYFSVEGYVLLNYIYEIEESNEFRNMLKKIAFKEEIEVNSLTKESVVEVMAQINNCLIKSEFKNLDGESEITFNIPIFVQYVALNETEMEIMVDAYSTETNCNLKVESINKLGKFLNVISEEKIDTIISVEEDMANINKALGVGAENINITKAFCQDKEIVVEGIAYANVVCEQDDEMNTLESIQAEVPFSLTIKNDDVMENDEIWAKAMFDDIRVKAKRGKDIEIEIDLQISANIYNTQKDAVLTGVECGEPLHANESTLQIMFASKGETLWQVAKNAKVKPEMITKQNPDLIFPLENNEKVILYKQK